MRVGGRNNTDYCEYHNDLGDDDIYFFDSDDGNYYVKRNANGSLNDGDMLFAVDRKDLPSIVRDYFDSLGITIDVDEI